MREFKSLFPEGLSAEYDAQLYGEEPIVTVEESKRRITISYTFPGFYLNDDIHRAEGKEVEFKQINIEGAGSLSENGKPQLPVFGRYVQIPFGCNYDVSVYPDEPIEFDGILVKPAQAELTDDPEQDYFFAYDEKLYGADELFPAQLVKVSNPYQIDGYTALLVHVCPLQFNPAQKKLLCYSKIEITIDIAEQKSDLEEHPFPDPDGGFEGFGNLFLNPRRNIEVRLDVDPRPGWIPSRLIRSGPEFMIIYHGTFKKAAEKLHRWKTMKGLRSKIVSINSIANYSSAVDDEARVASLKTYIRYCKKTRVFGGRFIIPRLKYIIFFGDVDQIASETITDDSVSGGNWGPVNITDYYYSTRKDPDNPADIVFPWLAVGRIPMRTAGEGIDVVDQIIKYEKTPPHDPDYYQRCTFAALFQDKANYWDSCDGQASRAYMRTMEEIRERMTSLGFDVSRVYVTDCPDTEMEYYSNGTSVTQEVKNAVVGAETATELLLSETSEGQLIIAHRDHGTVEGWHMPSFERHHLSDLTSDRPSIFFSLNCQTGWFDRAANSESFAETMLKTKGGAPSLIAATRNSSTTLNDQMMRALFDALWGGVLPTFPSSSTASYTVKNNRLGDILNYGKSYLPIVSSNKNLNKDHFEIYHVIGDPSLEVWKEEPKDIGMRIKLVADPRRGKVLTIRLNHCPQGGVVTIWYKENLMKRIEPSSTYITLSLKDLKFPPKPVPPFPSRRVPVYVCFGAPGYRFRRARVNIT